MYFFFRYFNNNNIKFIFINYIKYNFIKTIQLPDDAYLHTYEDKVDGEVNGNDDDCEKFCNEFNLLVLCVFLFHRINYIIY